MPEDLIKNYQPNDQVISTLKDIQLLATIGPSASGKTVVAQKMVDASDGFHFVLGETSRPPRPGEQNGIDYLFRTKDEIIGDLKEGLLVDVVLGPNGDLYSTRLSSYQPAIINVMALIPLAITKYRQLPLKLFKTAFIVPQTYQMWQKWLHERAEHSHWTAEQLGDRLEEAKKSYEFALADPNMSFVLNDQIDEAAKRLLHVAQGKSPDDEALARAAAQEIYADLKREARG